LTVSTSPDRSINVFERCCSAVKNNQITTGSADGSPPPLNRNGKSLASPHFFHDYSGIISMKISGERSESAESIW
jgi:hypothetical protein